MKLFFGSAQAHTRLATRTSRFVRALESQAMAIADYMGTIVATAVILAENVAFAEDEVNSRKGVGGQPMIDSI